MKKIVTLIGVLLLGAVPALAQSTLTLPMTDISSAIICAGGSVSITASAAAKGNALDFNGSTDSVLVPNSASVSLSGSGNFTVSCWIYPRSNKLQSILYHGRGCSTWGSWGLGIGGAESADAAWAKKLGFFFRTSNGSANKSVVSTDTLVLNQWVHAAVTYDGTNLKLYINGVLNNTSAVTGTPWNSTEKLAMGSDPGCSGRNYFNGKLDEVQIWSKVRSAAEITAFYNTIAPPSSPNLAAYWRFDENTGKDVYDVSANKNQGIISGADREIPSTAPLPVMRTDATTFTWSPATGLSATTGATVLAAPATTTEYTVKARNAVTGDTNTNIVRITVNPRAATPTVASPVLLCQGAAAAALTATKGSTTDTLLWYTTATGGSGSKTAPVPSTSATGTTFYYVSAKTNRGCESNRDTIKVIVNPIPAVPTAPSPIVYCQSAAAAPLTASAGSTADTLLWYTAATGGTGSKTAITPSTTTAGSKFYYVSARNTGCESKRDTIEVITKAAATPVVSSPVNYCVGETPSRLTATAGSTTDTLYWYTTATGGTGSLSAPTPSTATAGTTPYYVSARTTTDCESPRARIDVSVNAPAARPTVTSPLNLCKDATAAALTATKGSATDTLLWYTTATGGMGSKTAPTPSTTATGTTLYFVSGKSNKGCEGGRDTIAVTVNPVPSVPMVVTPVVYCQNATATELIATAGSSSDTLYWYTAATGGSGSKTTPVPSTAAAGTSSRYVSARNTFGCFSSRAKIDITINPKGATPGVTTPVHYCRYDTPVPLTATKGSARDTLLWYTAATGGSGSKTAPTPATTTPGSTPYYVSAKTDLGCEGDRATINVQVNPPADAPVATSPIVYCQYDKAVALTAAKGAASDTLIWYTVPSGGTGSRTAPVPATGMAGTTYYYVSARSSYSCEGARDTVEVVVHPVPAVTVSSLAPTGTVRCRYADSIVLKASAPTAVSYQWSYKAVPRAGAVSDTVHAQGTGYWSVSVTDAKGCRSKDSLWVQRDTLEEPVLTPAESRICKDAAVLLTCHPGYSTSTFTWYRNGVRMPGIPGTTNKINTADTGSYYAFVTNAAGCTYPANARVDYYPPVPQPVLVYTKPVLSVTGGSYRAFQWYRDAKWIFGATAGTYTVSDKAKYYVEVTDANGCTANSDTLEIQAPTSLQPQYAGMKLKLYPNPASTVVNIEAPVRVNVTVTDLAGKTVLSVRDARTVGLTDLADGSYIFLIMDENGVLLGTQQVHKRSF